MLIFKLENQTTEEVSRIFNTLQESIPYNDYKRLFQVILTDNGHEFFDVNYIECIQSSGEYVTHLFFCDPHMSCQKGMIEKIINLLDIYYLKVHHLRILPKKIVI